MRPQLPPQRLNPVKHAAAYSLPASGSTTRQNASVGSSSPVSSAKMQLSVLDGLHL